MAYSTLKTQVKVGAGQHLGFKTGKGYYAALGAPKAGAASTDTPADPFAPMSAAQIANTIAGYTASLPKPLTDAQIQLRAQGLLDPVVKSITDRETASAKAAGGAITGYSNELANRLAAYGNSSANIYGDAEGKQAAADAAFSGALSGGGSTLANALSAQFSKYGGNPADANQVAAIGAGAGNALLGTGTAALSNLIANEASSRDYGAKLPGLALRQGAADLRDNTMASQKTLADNIAQVEQGLPNIVEQLRGQSDTRATNRVNVANQVRSSLLARNDANAKFLRAEQDAGLNATTKANATVAAATIKANEKTAADAKPSASLSKTVGYVVDSNGNWIPGKDGKPQMLPGFTTDGHGNVVKTGKAPAGGKIPTPTQINTQIQKWHDGTGAYKTVTTRVKNPDGSTSSVSKKVPTGSNGQVPFQQAYSRLKAMGLDDATARHYLQGYYKRGELGRGWLTNEEQAALQAAKVAPRASVESGVGYLRPDQTAALKAAGLPLPPGHWIQGSTNTKDLGPVYIIEP